MTGNRERELNTLIKPFREALETLDRVGADRIFNQALATLTPIEAVGQVVVPALEQVGAAWQAGNVALSQVYMSGRFCEELVDKVLPASDPDRKHQPRSANRLVYTRLQPLALGTSLTGCCWYPPLAYKT